jgi:alpha-amylase
MPAVCFYFQVHQPYRLRPFTVFDIGQPGPPAYFDEARNAAIIERVAAKCYLPVNAILLELIRRHHGRFRVAFSVSGTTFDQLAEHVPAAIASFEELAATGCVEFLCETSHHSLAALFSWDEFRDQVLAQRERIRQFCGVEPTIFRNTELIYSDELAAHVAELGFAGILADGVPRILGGRTPGHLYSAAGHPELAVLCKHPSLSDDIAFRFSNRGWSEWPLTAPTYASWIRGLEGTEETVNLFMDYETFGEHQWKDSGILEFLDALPTALLRYPGNRFATPAELARTLPRRGEFSSADWISWADVDRDLTAWLGNSLQWDAGRSIYALRDAVLGSGDNALVRAWRRLLASDHLYYMCLKWAADGDVHKYFSPYESPYAAFINFMNVVSDLRLRCGLDEAAGRPVTAALEARGV